MFNSYLQWYNTSVNLHVYVTRSMLFRVKTNVFTRLHDRNNCELTWIERLLIFSNTREKSSKMYFEWLIKSLTLGFYKQNEFQGGTHFTIFKSATSFINSVRSNMRLHFVHDQPNLGDVLLARRLQKSWKIIEPLLNIFVKRFVLQ